MRVIMEMSGMMYTPDKPLISIHIPKCAGSSFSNILKTWFGNGYLHHIHDERRNKHPKKHNIYTGIISKRFKRGVCIHGHFNNARSNGVSDYYPEIDQFITIVRDPFDLHVSNYFYVKREAQNNSSGAYRSGLLHPIIANNWNLEDYLRENKRSYIPHFLPKHITIDNYQQVLGQSFLYIGITENLQRSIDILAGILGFPSIPVPHKNESEWAEQIPTGAREEFTSANPLAMAIYEYAVGNYGNQPSGTVTSSERM